MIKKNNNKAKNIQLYNPENQGSIQLYNTRNLRLNSQVNNVVRN